MKNYYGMSKYKNVKYPSELLARWLHEHNLSQAWLCRVMGRPEKTISEIMSGIASVTAKTAVELEKVTGIKAGYWLQLQNNLDLEKVANDKT